MFLSIKKRDKICTGLEFALILQPQTGNRTSLTRGADGPGSDKNIDILLPRQAAKVVLRVQGHTNKVSPVNTEKTIEGILNRQQSKEDI